MSEKKKTIRASTAIAVEGVVMVAKMKAAEIQDFTKTLTSLLANDLVGNSTLVYSNAERKVVADFEDQLMDIIYGDHEISLLWDRLNVEIQKPKLPRGKSRKSFK